MLQIGCSGFPIPATRYFKSFGLEEIADTFVGVPGPALLRRWINEAPPTFVFTALAPRETTAAGFTDDARASTAWERFIPVAVALHVRAIVFTTPADLPATAKIREAARAAFQRVGRKPPAPLVWEPPAHWDLDVCEATVRELPIVVARDPSRHPPFTAGALAYYRLPGPAGIKSRYEDALLEHAANGVRATRCEEVMVVFANADMATDATRMMRLLA